MLSSSRHRAHLLLGSALLAMTATPALAQTAAAPAPATPQDQTTPAPTPADAGEGLTDIIVTATKVSTNLQKTPIAMAVLDTKALTDRHVQSLYDLADGAVPSLRIATFEARQSALTIGIRGIVPLDANQPAREQGVGIYIDGVYLGRQHGLNAALFDVERIEVLKGPQGTLFGRNTEGGALSIVTKAPSGEFGGRVSGGISNFGGYNADAHIDLPAFMGFSVKLDGVLQYQGATTKNPLAGQTGWNYYDRRGGRVAVRWKPAEGITDDFSYDNAYDANTPFYSQLLNFNPNNCAAGTQASQPACTLPGTAYTTLTGAVKPLLPGVVVAGTTRMGTADIGVPQQPSIDKSYGFTNTFKWNLGPEFEFRSITAWRGVNATQWDNSGGAHRVPVVTLPAIGATNPTTCTVAAPCGFSRYSLADLRQRQFSQEFQAVGKISSVSYVAGFYYFFEHVSDDAATPNSNGIVANTTLVGGVPTVSGYNYVILDPCTGSGGFGSQVGCRSIDRASEVRSRSYAVYGQLTWDATDFLHITAGGRYTHDKKEGVLHLFRNVNYDNPANAAIVAANGYAPLNKTWSRFNPMVTLAVDASDDVHFYAKYSSGYRAGGASSRTANYQAFNPEDVKAYEVGMKAEFLDRRVRLNLAGYIMDRKDSQVDISSIQTAAGSNVNVLRTINAPGNTKIRGIEADLTVRPVTGLTLTASYAYTYTKIPPVAIVNSVTVGGVTTSTTAFQNFYIVFTPRNAASGSIDYEVPVGGGDTRVRFHLDANYAQSTQAFDQFALKADSSFIVNGRLSLADIKLSGSGQKITFSLWGRNLFDEQYVFRRDPSNSLPGTPTTNVTSGSIANVIGDYGNFNAPRTFGIEAALKF
ncbi:TonB-dependent receptor [Sphingomonas bacterium]|uniref:TonB-dependent receptor n=1 Tax=Sphingomonas bacterium TaxID=1895847 RepID=UPI00262F1179|nr:TonB-dependent receptor [Sphingomonas bacterium]MDB5679179.1 iron complex outerrane recepter protein [Sphingomonas bacterium]